MAKPGTIRVGVGGWDFAPWRETFYPPKLPQREALHYASRQLTAIEINATYYRTQAPESFARWHAQTPDDFVFAVKASRYATNRKDLGEAGPSIAHFLDSGIGLLGKKLGPLLWQLAPTKKFNADEIESFLSLLPATLDDGAKGIRLRHVLDARHESFMDPAYLKLARRYKLTTVFTDSDDYPSFADLTGGLVYARLMRTRAACRTGYSAKALAAWAARAQEWSEGGRPAGPDYVEDKGGRKLARRDVFLFYISGAKERAPAAAVETIRQLRLASGAQPAARISRVRN